VSRYRRRPSGHKDSNHDAVVKALRQLGATVLETHALGDDAPDLVVGYQGVTALVELKSGDRVLGRQHVTVAVKRERLERQRAYLDAWAGGLAFIAETTEQVLQAFASASVPVPLFAHARPEIQGSSWSPHRLLVTPGPPGSAAPDTTTPSHTPPLARPAVRRAVRAPASGPAIPEA
jgi:Holliday junction resolvase